ncbi:MAG: PKD domain-containing protein [Thermoanaerobaculia bacterium]
MTPSMGWTRPRWLPGALAVVSLLTNAPALRAATGPVTDELRILRGPGALLEGSEMQFAVRLDKRPLVTASDGYLPAGESLTTWEPEVEFLWNFHDGTGPISTGERPDVIHTFADKGEYTVDVEARSRGGSVRGSLKVKVRDRRPFGPAITAVEIDPATATFEFSAAAFAPSGDELRFDWAFGDGTQPVEYAPWKITHAYAAAGEYQVKVYIRDDDGDGARTETIRIVTAGPIGGPSPGATGPESTHFDAELSGSLSASLEAEIRPMATIFLAPVAEDRCRFLFTAWDPSKLAHAEFILDMNGLPGEKGGRFTFLPGNVRVNFETTREQYELARKTLLQSGVAGGLGEVVARQVWGDGIDEALDEVDDASGGGLVGEVNERLGVVELGRRVSQGEFGAPPAKSPFGLADPVNFKAKRGFLNLDFVPRDRAVGRMELHLENTDEKSPYTAATLSGDFAIDLADALRDGLFLYERCAPASFAVQSVAPEPDEMHVFGARPRVVVRFTAPYDVGTLDSSTFELTYPRAGSGVPVVVETELHRMESGAFLVPKSDLWGGIQYTARVKTGPDGVRGRNGGTLEDPTATNSATGTGWHGWKFWTAIDFEARGTDGANLGCHVVQVVHDAPLVPGRWAAAQLLPSWKKNPRVHDDAQMKAFATRVALEKPSGDGFVEVGRSVQAAILYRPDVLTASSGLSPSARRVNLQFLPDASTPASLRIRLDPVTGPDSRGSRRYRALCSTPVWNREPVLRVDLALVRSESSPDVDYLRERGRSEALLSTVATRLESLLPRVFPLREVRVNVRETVDVTSDRHIDEIVGGRGSIWDQWLGKFGDPDESGGSVRSQGDFWERAVLGTRSRAERSNADLFLGILDIDVKRLRVRLHPLANVVSLVDAYPASAVVASALDLPDGPGWIAHQIAHALDLGDAPDVILHDGGGGGIEHRADDDMDEAAAIVSHEGIAGAIVHEESVQMLPGRDQPPLLPVMLPVPTESGRFILRHHYLELQEKLEDGGILPAGSGN